MLLVLFQRFQHLSHKPHHELSANSHNHINTPNQQATRDGTIDGTIYIPVPPSPTFQSMLDNPCPKYHHAPTHVPRTHSPDYGDRNLAIAGHGIEGSPRENYFKMFKGSRFTEFRDFRE